MSGAGPVTSTTVRMIISDLHAGDPASLLTVLDDTYSPLPGVVSPTTSSFSKAILATLNAMQLPALPELILLGDGMDFSLAKPDQSAAVLAKFLAALSPAQTFGQISFVPGNHDHALWTLGRGGAAPSQGSDPGKAAYWAHTSPAFVPPSGVGTTRILNDVLKAAGQLLPVATYYPNLGLLPAQPAPSGLRRAVVLHHGHFVESTYLTMSSVLSALSGRSMFPMMAKAIEAANGSWIDFMFSAFGDDGALGKQVSLYERVMEDGAGAKAFQDRLAAFLTRQLLQSLPLPMTPQLTTALGYISKGLVDVIVGSAGQAERYSYNEYLTPSSLQGLIAYIGQVVLTQMVDELGANNLPEQVTFIFGHTHKPFADQIVVPGFAAPVSVYNSGGWVLDIPQMSSVEGASVVFVDGDLNTATLQVYGMSENGSVLPAVVSSADPIPDAENPMFLKLEKSVKANSKLWDSFRDTVEAELIKKCNMYLALADTEAARSTPMGLAR